MSKERAPAAEHLFPCPRCKAPQMAEVVSIAPQLHEPGLIAYECPRCGYVSSVLVPAPDAHTGSSG